MNLYEDLITALRQQNKRITPQREAICRLLAESPDHPTATQIYATLLSRFPSMSLATVYNTLETLVALGKVNALGNAGDDAVHYDADVSPHVNLACISCHRVIDLQSEHIQALEQEVTQNSHYQLLGARVLYYGLCPECQARNG
ncbi:MAG: Fur family transcriptional regulator [Anaerolineales bacterium]